MHRPHYINTILNEVPVVGQTLKGGKIVKVKKISSGNDFVSGYYKIVSKGRYGRRRKFMAHVTAVAKTSLHFGRLS